MHRGTVSSHFLTSGSKVWRWGMHCLMFSQEVLFRHLLHAPSSAWLSTMGATVWVGKLARICLCHSYTHLPPERAMHMQRVHEVHFPLKCHTYVSCELLWMTTLDVIAKGTYYKLFSLATYLHLRCHTLSYCWPPKECLVHRNQHWAQCWQKHDVGSAGTSWHSVKSTIRKISWHYLN